MLTNLYERIKGYRNENKEELNYLLDKFDLLINKYAKKLNYEDAKQDMILEFIKIIQKIPIENNEFKYNKYVIGYITTALKNNYILLSKKRSKYQEFEIFSNLIIELSGENDKNISKCIVDDYLRYLSNKESNIIIELVIKGKTASQLAEEYNISRQAINQTKIRALDKLRSIVI